MLPGREDLLGADYLIAADGGADIVHAAGPPTRSRVPACRRLAACGPGQVGRLPSCSVYGLRRCVRRWGARRPGLAASPNPASGGRDHQGLLYPLSGETLYRAATRGVSNELTGTRARVSHGPGDLLIVQHRMG